MSGLKLMTGALVMGLMLAASPNLANARVHDWRNARAEAIPESGALPIGGMRALAIHDCNSKIAKLKDYTWGDEEVQRYRACMATHGQLE